MIPPRIELGTFCVLGRCDNRYTTESSVAVARQNVLKARLAGCAQAVRGTGAVGKRNGMRQPGVEPGSTAWKATMLTATPLSLLESESGTNVSHSVGPVAARKKPVGCRELTSSRPPGRAGEVGAREESRGQHS